MWEPNFGHPTACSRPDARWLIPSGSGASPGTDRRGAPLSGRYRWQWNTAQGFAFRKCREMTEPTIGERLRELRRGIFTQHDLAAAADVSIDVIRKLEQAAGTPPPSPPWRASPVHWASTSPNC